MLQSSRRQKCESFKIDDTMQRKCAGVYLSSCFYQGNLTTSGETRREFFSWPQIVSDNRTAERHGESEKMQEPTINTKAKRHDTFDMRTKRGGAAFVDAIWNRAIDVICRTGRASVAHFQRQLCISYSSAVDLIDELECRGIIGPKRQGWPTREILIQTRTNSKTKE